MRRGLLVLLAVLIALGIAHFAYWRYAQRELAAGYARWVADAGRHGWQLTARAVPDGGWPTKPACG